MRGDGRIFQRGTKWWISYYAPHNGKRVETREPAGSTPKDAERLLRERRKELALHEAGMRPFQGPRHEHTPFTTILETALEDYEVRGVKSIASITSQAKHLKKYFGLDRAAAINADRVRTYIATRQEQGAAPASINRELSVLRKTLNLAVSEGTISFAPKIQELPEQNARQGFFDTTTFHRVLQHIDDQDLTDYLTWCFWTGMRPREIKSLTWNSIDHETSTLRLHARDAKNGHGRALAIVGPLKTTIEARLARRAKDCPHVFHRNGKPVGEFRTTWKNACNAAGVPGMLVYDLRRTAVRNMVRAGVDPTVAMKISGHKTREVFDRYNIINDEDLRSAMERTTRYIERAAGSAVSAETS